MQRSFLAMSLVITILACSAGCSAPAPAEQPLTTIQTPLPAGTSPQENRNATVPPSEMALQVTDIDSDYIIRDRSVMILPEVTQLSRDLGWREGYFVHLYRLDKDRDDQTFVRQSISIFPFENIHKAFTIEKEDMRARSTGSGTFYEIPFPPIGDESVAFRGSFTGSPFDTVVYTVLFIKKNVYEKITMTGTTTDYEALKSISRMAADKVR